MQEALVLGESAIVHNVAGDGRHQVSARGCGAVVNVPVSDGHKRQRVERVKVSFYGATIGDGGCEFMNDTSLKLRR